jgi:hypothetical protein
MRSDIMKRAAEQNRIFPLDLELHVFDDGQYIMSSPQALSAFSSSFFCTSGLF